MNAFFEKARSLLSIKQDHTELSEKKLEEISQHPNWSVRLTAAQNTHTPPHVLALLAEDVNSQVRLAATENPGIPQYGLTNFSWTQAHDALRYQAGEYEYTQWFLRAVQQEMLHPAAAPVSKYKADRKSHALTDDQRAIALIAADPHTSAERLKEISQLAVPELQFQVAQNVNTPTDVLEQLSSSKDAMVLWAVASNRNTSAAVLAKLAHTNTHELMLAVGNNIHTAPEMLSELAASTDTAVRSAVAENPNTPSEILLQLAQDKQDDVRLAAAQNRYLSADTLDNWARQGIASVIFMIARHPNISEHTLEHLAQDANVYVRRAAVMRDMLSPRLRSAFVHDSDAGVRMIISLSRHTTPRQLSRLARDAEIPVRSGAARNPNTPEEALIRLAADKDDNVRLSVASNPNASEEVLQQLSEDWFAPIHSAIAGNPAASSDLLTRLSSSNLNEVRCAVAENPSSNGILLAKLASDPELAVQRSVAMNPNTPVETLEFLADSPEAQVRSAVAQNPSIPNEVRLDLLHDTDAAVCSAAVNSISLEKQKAAAAPPDSRPDLFPVDAKEAQPSAQDGSQERTTAPISESDSSHTSAERLFEALQTGSPIALIIVLLQAVIASRNVSALCKAAKDPKSPPEVLTILANHRNWRVRAAVAQNVNLPKELEEKLSKDWSSRVRDSLSDRKTEPEQVSSEPSTDKTDENSNVQEKGAENIMPDYSISVSRNAFDNRCTIYFPDGDAIDVDGSHYGRVFTEMSAQELDSFVRDNLENIRLTDRVKNSEISGLPQNAGYYILAETERRALGFSPYAQDKLVVWDKADGDYVNGHYGSTLNQFEIADLRFLNLDMNRALSLLKNVDYDYREHTAAPQTSENAPANESEEPKAAPEARPAVYENVPANEPEESKAAPEARPTVYVCSPLSGEIEENIRLAREYCRFVAQQGNTPIAPHITELFNDDVPEEREQGLQMGLDYLRKADELWVFGDLMSEGMAAEIRLAQEELHIPIYHVNPKTYHKADFNTNPRGIAEVYQAMITGDIEKEAPAFQQDPTINIQPYRKIEEEADFIYPVEPPMQEAAVQPRGQEKQTAKRNPQETPIPRNFTRDQLQRAKQTDLLTYVQNRGYMVKRAGSTAYRLIEGEHDSLTIFPNTNSWYNFNTNEGGDIVDFLVKKEHKNMVQAVHDLLGESFDPQQLASRSAPKPHQAMNLPKRAENNRRVFAYLIKTRGLDRDLVAQCVDSGDIFESSTKIKKGEQTYDIHNCVFVGKDENNVPRYASQRSINDAAGPVYKSDVLNSEKEYGFLLRGKDSAEWLSVCEAPIDALSIASLYKLRGQEFSDEHILSLGGVSDNALEEFLKHNDKIKTINICLDNDGAGHVAGERIREKYGDRYQIAESYPQEKDYNLELQKARAEQQESHVILPPSSAENKWIYSYLTAQRHIAPEVAQEWLNSERAYQCVRPLGNTGRDTADIVFVQRNGDNIPVYGISVSQNFNPERTDFKTEYEGTDIENQYISRQGETSVLRVFNNPLSMLTCQTLQLAKGQTEQDHYLCCGSHHAESVQEYLSKHSEINEVRVMLDPTRTPSGQDLREKAFDRLRSAGEKRKVKVAKQYPKGVDLNRDMQAAFKQGRQQANNKSRDREQDGFERE